MSDSVIFHFVTPPIPYFLDCGRTFYHAGECHISRKNTRVFDLIVVIKGSLFLGEAANEWEIQQGEALILRPDAHHYGAAPCPSDTEIIWIHFQTFGAWNEYADMDMCKQCLPMLIEDHRQTAFLNHTEVCSILIPKRIKLPKPAMDDLEQFFSLDVEPPSMRNWKKQIAFQKYLQRLDMDLASRSDLAILNLAEKIECYIRQNYKRKISNSILQHELNYHANYLAKCMIKIYGMTPMEYLQRFRLDQAKKLLIQTEWSIERIAEEVGYENASYFSFSFSKKEGVSPINYRRKFIAHP